MGGGGRVGGQREVRGSMIRVRNNEWWVGRGFCAAAGEGRCQHNRGGKQWGEGRGSREGGGVVGTDKCAAEK